MALDYNTLIISDLHLGEDLSPSANEGTTRHVDLVEKQLVAFFGHYSKRRENGRPWRILVNGDMVDFMAITILPNRPEIARLVADRGPDDDEFGLRRTVNASLAKVLMVAERHAELFTAMARFVSRGNRIDIVCGNHDIEFHWPEIQHAFREAVVSSHGTLPDEAARDRLRQGIDFHPWFFYEPGVAWIEHGHQYDENCSFDYNLNPLHPTDVEILTNVDTAGTRYVTNYVREVDAHAQEDWSASGYFKFAVGLGVRGTFRIARAYYAFARALLSVRKATLRPKGRKARSPQHDARLSDLAARWNIDLDTLIAIDSLRRRPVVSSLRKLMVVLMLDKLCIFGAAIVAALIAILVMGTGWGLAVTAIALVFAWALAWLSGRGRNVDPGAPLRLVPERILDKVDAEYVVFGHTHKPLRLPVEGKGVYFNTGTWLPSGKPGLLRAFTHVVISHEPSGARARLCQWRDGASREFTAPDGVPLVDGKAARRALSGAKDDGYSPAASTEPPR